jgi:septal ring factor EnvC (AmiA/AmiB activator)
MSTRRPSRRRRALLALLVLGPLAACRQLTNPAADVELQQSLYDLQDLLAEMRDQTAQLQWQVDSLQQVVARQDSVVRRVANLVGMPMAPVTPP